MHAKAKQGGKPRRPHTPVAPPVEWPAVLARLAVAHDLQEATPRIKEKAEQTRALSHACRDAAVELERGRPLGSQQEGALRAAAMALLADGGRTGDPLADRALDDMLVVALNRYWDGPSLLGAPTTAEQMHSVAMACADTAERLDGLARLAPRDARRVRGSGGGDGGRLPDIARLELARWADDRDIGPRALAHWLVEAGILPGASWLPFKKGSVVGESREAAIDQWQELLKSDRQRLRRGSKARE